VRVSSFAARVAQSYHEFNQDKYRKVAESLITRDEADLSKPFGQAMRSTFPRADVFIDGTSRSNITRGIGRFIDLLFNKPFETPTCDEVGMNFAHAAALRSADLSRQVGAVIMSQAGEVLAVGCNETPKPAGGHYWGGDPNDARDFVLGHDPSTKMKAEMIIELLRVLRSNDWLISEEVSPETRKTVYASLEKLMEETKQNGEPEIFADSQITNIIEYGRVVHAEMSAITEAARRGISVKGAILYCTTYPCHICARHIISSGIARVVYVEPYPKSMTQRLYPKATTTDRTDATNLRVLFEPFLGVSPNKYNEVFEIYGARKNKRGDATKWKRGTAEPRLERMIESYLGVENFAIGALEGGLQRANLTMWH
jgi:deoxycytidylate deaminase